MCSKCVHASVVPENLLSGELPVGILSVAGDWVQQHETVPRWAFDAFEDGDSITRLGKEMGYIQILIPAKPDYPPGYEGDHEWALLKLCGECGHGGEPCMCPDHFCYICGSASWMRCQCQEVVEMDEQDRDPYPWET